MSPRSITHSLWIQEHYLSHQNELYKHVRIRIIKMLWCEVTIKIHWIYFPLSSLSRAIKSRNKRSSYFWTDGVVYNSLCWLIYMTCCQRDWLIVWTVGAGCKQGLKSLLVGLGPATGLKTRALYVPCQPYLPQYKTFQEGLEHVLRL